MPSKLFKKRSLAECGLRRQPDYGEEGSYTQEMNEANKSAAVGQQDVERFISQFQSLIQHNLGKFRTTLMKPLGYKELTKLLAKELEVSEELADLLVPIVSQVTDRTMQIGAIKTPMRTILRSPAWKQLQKSAVCMSDEEFLAEHIHLVDVLRHGDRNTLDAEAKDQEAEIPEGKVGSRKTANTVTLYHGTPADFDQFELKPGARSYGPFSEEMVENHGVFLTDNIEFAKTRGDRVLTCQVNVNEDHWIDLSWESLQERMDNCDRVETHEEGYPFKWEGDIVIDSLYEATNNDYQKVFNIIRWGKNDWELFDDKRFVDALKKRGIQGAIFQEDDYDTGAESKTFMVFNPQMIKIVGDTRKQGSRKQASYWCKAAAGVVPLCITTGRILMGLRGTDCDNPETWGIPAGKIEDGEHEEEAARREMAEETGCPVADTMELVQIYRDETPDFTFTTYLGFLEEEFTPNPPGEFADENQEFRWVEWGDWPEPLHPGFEASIPEIEPAIDQVIDAFNEIPDDPNS